MVIASTAIAGCNSDHLCNLVAADSRAIVTVDQAFLDKVDSATVKVCHDNACAEHRESLSPTFGRGAGRTFVPFSNAELPTEPLQVTVSLFAGDGRVVVSKNFEAEPEVGYPNGKGCDPEVRSLAFRVDAVGNLLLDDPPDW